jgi:F420-0:gamma-glutamyl ligase-like protein
MIFMDAQLINLQPNDSKSLHIETDYGTFARYPVHTHVITETDELPQVIDAYLPAQLRQDDYLFVSEKVVAIMQGRAFPIDEIEAGWWAHTLSKFVKKSPYGIGLGMPCTMELAIGEIGLPKVLVAAACAAVTKPLGISGVFYRVLGEQARAIDGPCDYTLPPYNRYAKLAPAAPNEVARELSEQCGVKSVVIDANDLGVDVLGKSDHAGINDDFCRQVFRDNPLGQASEQTPLCIVRRAA